MVNFTELPLGPLSRLWEKYNTNEQQQLEGIHLINTLFFKHYGTLTADLYLINITKYRSQHLIGIILP